ncbi:hypothetical protein [Sphingomonas sp. SRS2]|uniref:hypothetical protein n=1 Tax=Sphingomonas sp. SRS2 TaxID=133190 RepID=UPI0006184163|nr:hypothetical protein [Sphingomonas sp. SRS2]KKC26277.1 hypothetical protein WP12_09400 [Sphingomonas sp. SRS2]
MKRLSMLVCLLSMPASGWAQGLPFDFDPEPVAIEAVQSSPIASTRRDEANGTRPVRYAARNVRMVNGTSPMAAELDMSRLPDAER